jgi:hypothetical protein
VHDERN